MVAEGFWNDQKAAQEIISESNKLKRVVNGLTEFKAKFEDSKAMEELLEEAACKAATPTAAKA